MTSGLSIERSWNPNREETTKNKKQLIYLEYEAMHEKLREANCEGTCCGPHMPGECVQVIRGGVVLSGGAYRH